MLESLDERIAAMARRTDQGTRNRSTRANNRPVGRAEPDLRSAVADISRRQQELGGRSSRRPAFADNRSGDQRPAANQNLERRFSDIASEIAGLRSDISQQFKAR